MNLMKLRRTLIRCFDESELRDICFDLDIDYESLPGEGKRAKIRELISYLERRERTSELVETVREMRPQAAWEEVSRPPGKTVADQEAPGRRGRELRATLVLPAALALVVVTLGGVFLYRHGWPYRPGAPAITPTVSAPTPTAPLPGPTAVPPSPTALSPSPTVPVPSPTPSLPAVEIVHIEYDPEGSDLDGEYILLRNTTEAVQDLTAWTIEDSDDHVFRFGSFLLAPGATVKVWTKTGDDTETDVHWGYGRGLWDNDGDTATLRDYRDQEVATFTYSP